MNCPHCGALPRLMDRGPQHFTCWTQIYDTADRGTGCYERQISQLKSELSQCVRRDDPRFGVIRSEIQLVQRLTQNPTFRLSLEFADKQLQSIIEVK